MTAAEILALLAADPALAVEVAAGLPRLRIAGPWEGDARMWAGMGVRIVAEVEPDGEGWGWTLCVEPGESGYADTRAKAEGTADAALVAADWRLA